MDFTFSITDGARTIALSKAQAAYNAAHQNATLNPTEFVQKMVENQLDTLAASYLTLKLSKLSFLDRFTPDERIAIREAAKTNAQVNDYLELLNAAEEVDLTSSRTTGGVAALEAAGLIVAGRSAQILSLL